MEWKEFYTYEEGYLISKRTNKAMCKYDDEGYLRIRRMGKEYRGHRIIWEMFNGPIPEGYLIDHIDGDPYNNKIENLRLATRGQNNANRTSTSNRNLPKGVTKQGNKYRARLHHNGKTHCLGSYFTPEEAKQAYDTKAIELHGQFARIE